MCTHDLKGLLGCFQFLCYSVGRQCVHARPNFHFHNENTKVSTSELSIRLIFVFSNTVIGTNRCLILRVAQSFVTLLNMVISPSIIDAIVIYTLLIKHEAKIAGYWQSSFFAFLWIETKSRSLKTEGKNVFRRQEGVMVPGVPCVDPGNWERDRANVLVSRSKILFHGVEDENEMAICHLF